VTGPDITTKRPMATLSRADLAHFMLSLVGDPMSVRTKPVIVM
jgi:hypothetical protein